MTVHDVPSWAGFVLPPWGRGAALFTLLGVLVVTGAIVVDLGLLLAGRLRSRSAPDAAVIRPW